MLRRWMKWLRGGGDGDPPEDPPEDRAPVEELSRKQLPFRWGPYTLLKHLGTGSLGETFIARKAAGDPSPVPATPEDLAKELLIVRRGLVRIATSPFLQLFMSEHLSLYQELRHPQICRLLHAGEQEGIPVIVSEYAMGKRAPDLLRHGKIRKEPLPWPIAVYIAHELCVVLEYLHGKKDPEGSNWNLVAFRGGFTLADIFVGYSGEVRLADIGISYIRRHQTGPMLPEGWTVLDRPFYFSPEAVRGEVLSQASDIFCVGWLLWELATAGWLFAGESEFEKLTRIRDADVQPPRELNPAIPDRVEEIILKALARAPADRHASAAELRSQLAATTDMESAREALETFMHSVFARDLGKTRDELLRWARD